MGCSATKSLAVEPLGDLANGHSHINRVASSPETSNTPPLAVEDLPDEYFDCSNVNNLQKAPDGMAYDIPFEEDNADDSIIKKHPPKRFQKLVDQPSSPVTLNKLQEKLEEAEIRRQQILAQRIQSAKYRNKLRKEGSGRSSGKEETGFLRVPDDLPSSPNPQVV